MKNKHQIHFALVQGMKNNDLSWNTLGSVGIHGVFLDPSYKAHVFATSRTNLATNRTSEFSDFLKKKSDVCGATLNFYKMNQPIPAIHPSLQAFLAPSSPLQAKRHLLESRWYGYPQMRSVQVKMLIGCFGKQFKDPSKPIHI